MGEDHKEFLQKHLPNNDQKWLFMGYWLDHDLATGLTVVRPLLNLLTRISPTDRCRPPFFRPFTL